MSDLHDPMDYSLPGSSVHGIFQARVLEWGAIAFSKWEGMPTQRLKESGGVHGERERESESVREREREHVGERASPFLLPS